MSKKLITAVWCAPCRMLKTRLAEANIEVDLVDADENADYIKEMGVRSVPTLVIEDGDKLTIISKYEKIVENLLGT